MINSATTAKLRALAEGPANLFEVVGWIKADEFMPQANRLVLASYGGGLAFIMLWNGQQWFNAEGPRLVPKTRRVRYWAYIPHGPIDADPDS